MGELYEAASVIAKKHGYDTIIDLGCYMAAQSFLFEDYKKYIGVDIYDDPYIFRDGYKPPERFISDNAEHFSMSIEDFIEKEVPNMDLSDSLVLVSAVPGVNTGGDSALGKRILDAFPAVMMYYPGYGYTVKSLTSNNGINEIHKLAKEIKDARCPYNTRWKKDNPNKAKLYEEKEEKLMTKICKMMISLTPTGKPVELAETARF